MDAFITHLVTWLAGGVLGAVLSRVSVREAHRRAGRTDLSDRIEWALTRSVSSHELEARMGIRQLRVLLGDPTCTDAHRRRIEVGLEALTSGDGPLEAPRVIALDAGEMMDAVEEDRP